MPMRKKHSNKHKSGRLKTRTTVKLFIFSTGFLLLSYLLILLAKNNTSFVDDIFIPWSVWIMDVVSKITGWFRFSFTEVVIYISVTAFIISFIILIKNLIRNQYRFRYLFRYIAVILFICSMGVFVFYSSWGLAYYSAGIADSLEFDVKERSVDELVELNRYLITKANDLSKAVERDDNGSFTGYDFSVYADKAADAFSAYTGKDEAIPKYVMMSPLWSYTQTTGVFIPLTGEALVNSNDQALALPFTMAHEIAHRNCVTHENEANFLAFYTLKGSADTYLEYSAYSFALIYCMNSLHAADYEKWNELAQTYSNELDFDYTEYSEHWDKYEGKVADISTQINDNYLKSNGQEDGVQTYGQVTDLILAWYEKEVME